jgi:hypothetical protein
MSHPPSLPTHRPQDAALMRVPAAAVDPASFLVGVFDGHGRTGEIISAFCKVMHGLLLVNDA